MEWFCSEDDGNMGKLIAGGNGGPGGAGRTTGCGTGPGPGIPTHCTVYPGAPTALY